MRVLMFGWEFPPHIAGGLGTACYGMTRGLARNDVEVIFVMPRASGDEDERFVKVVNASDVEARYCDSKIEGADDIMRKISFIHIDSNMVPYISPEEFETYREGYERTGKKFWEREGDSWTQRYTFSGKYGANLMEEVARYAVVAAEVARQLEKLGVDVIEAGFPANKVIGSGTSLDTARLQLMIGKKLCINPKNIQAYVIGEHGDSEFIPWSNANISLQNIKEFFNIRNRIGIKNSK